MTETSSVEVIINSGVDSEEICDENESVDSTVVETSDWYDVVNISKLDVDSVDDESFVVEKEVISVNISVDSVENAKTYYKY